MLTGKNLSKKFGGLLALSDVSFSLSRGEILGLMGPNGAGKTTLIDLITGFEKPSGGQITLDGRDLARISPQGIVKLGLARSYQHAKPFPELTVGQNVEAGLAFGARPRQNARIPQRVDEILAFVDLSHRVAVPAGTLTAVEKKKLEMARVLACGPTYVLLDELMQGLNSAEKVQAAELVRRVRDQFDVAILIVEHNVRALRSICDRLLVLNYGCKIADGLPAEVLRDPEVVRAYLGEEIESQSELPRAQTT